ncbi:glucosaminidase domain-containing protein [Lentzea tibetensis]|uniref:glucosaminidase domain-containing protein n=1 Tax=Lentzea tibetensis TaxID=2591470 RepID=UPI00164773B9|nr:glucosaminidase domain-containing protein [Lentzea tibetensis]
MKKLTAALLATAFAGLVAGTAHAEPQEVESRYGPMNAVTAAGEQDFINLITPDAQAVQAEYRIPASVTAGQAIHESAWGRSKLTVNDKNYFGIKCHDSPPKPGPIAIGCAGYPTQECTPTCHPTTAYFRVYRSMTDSFRDYGRTITQTRTYDYALPYRDDPDRFIREIAKRYATDPNYANSVIALMQTHNLYRLDTRTGSSLSGDGRAEIAKVGADGNVIAWRNDNGFADRPYGDDAIIATEFSNDNIQFADLDGDGRTEIIKVGDDGNVIAWKNVHGFADRPYGDSHIIATEFTADNIQFADLNGDRKAEIIKVGDDGNVIAWRNDNGFAPDTYRTSNLIATEFTADNIHFGDLNGDGRAEIAKVGADGNVQAWRNDKGFADRPYGDSHIIATEFTADNIQFADLNGDGRTEIIKVGADGNVIAWRNDNGFAPDTYRTSNLIATEFTADNIQFA